MFDGNQDNKSNKTIIPLENMIVIAKDKGKKEKIK